MLIGTALLVQPALGFGGASQAHAAEATFPYTNNFTSQEGGTLSGFASIADGWLTLTPNVNNRSGAWQMDDTFSSELGIDVTFDYATYGGRGANGLSFFLSDGAAEQGVGGLGAALGYAATQRNGYAPGIPGAYIGLGLDEFGAFSENEFFDTGLPARAPDTYALRGSGDGVTGYDFITNTPAPGGVATGSRAGARSVRVVIMPDKATGDLLLTVWVDRGPGTALTPVFSEVNLSTLPGQTELPETLRLGFAGGTGTFTNVHEVKNLSVTVPTDLAIAGSASPTVVAGEQVTYTVDVSNTSSVPVRGAVLTDELPESITDVSWTCAATTGACGEASGTGDRIRTTADLPVNGSVTYTITGTVGGDARTMENTATITAPSDRNDVDETNNTSTASTVVTSSADVALTKATTSDTPVGPSETFEYRLEASNAGPSTAENVSVTDPLPAGLVFVSSPDACTAAGRLVSCGPMTALAAGASAAWTFTVRLDADYSGDGSDLGNTATASSTTPDPNPGNNSNTPATPPPGGTIAPGTADLSLTKATTTDVPVAPGQTFDYRLTATNAGPTAGRDVRVTDPLPVGLSFVSSVDGCTASGRDVTCGTEPGLAVGASTSWTFTVAIDSGYLGDGADLGNVATVQGASIDPHPGNNSNAPATLPPGGSVAAAAADLAMTKVTTTDVPVAPGETFDYRLTASNAGPSDAVGVRVTDPLPAGLTFVSSTDGCTAVGRDVSCGTAQAMRPGATTSWVFTARIDPGYTGDGFDLGNTATVASSTFDPNPADNSNTPPTMPPGGVVAPASADLSLLKRANLPAGGVIAPGDTFSYTMTVTNAGPSHAAAVIVRDPLPAMLSFVSSPDGCTAQGQAVVCPPRDVLAVGEQVSWTIRVRLSPTYTGDGSDIVNVASVSSGTVDPNPGDNSNDPDDGAGKVVVAVAGGPPALAFTGFDLVPIGLLAAGVVLIGVLAFLLHARRRPRPE